MSVPALVLSCVAVGLIVYNTTAVLPHDDSRSALQRGVVIYRLVSVALLHLQLSNLRIIPYPLCRSPEPEPEPQPAKVTDVRLPTHLEPLTYRLELVPFIIPDNFTIRGLVEIGGQSPVVFI